MITPDFFVLPPAADTKEDCFSRLYAMGHENIIAQYTIEHIATGLYGLFQSLGIPAPVVRLTEGDQLTQKVAKALHHLYKDHQSPTTGPQPVLVLLDRFNDLNSMVYHSSSYLS